MCSEEAALWMDAIDAREEMDFQTAHSLDPVKFSTTKQGADVRRKILRESEYRWHDKMRMTVDLRRLRK